MFAIKPRSTQPKAPRIELSRLTSLVGADVEVQGDLVFSGGLRIDGRVRGNVIGRPGVGKDAALVVLSRSALVEGSIRCAEVVIDGEVVGDIESERFVDLQSNARVRGVVRYQQLRMDVGAAVQGELRRTDMDARPANVVELASPIEPRQAVNGERG